jgi:hypothetical protein
MEKNYPVMVRGLIRAKTDTGAATRAQMRIYDLLLKFLLPPPPVFHYEPTSIFMRINWYE